ncbi:restriction endonuclease [Caproiciproducens sp. LBM24188]
MIMELKKMEVENVQFWDDKSNKFFDFPLTAKFEENNIRLYCAGKLVSNIIELPKDILVPVTVTPTKYTNYIVKIANLVFCMTKAQADTVENYFKDYNKQIEDYLTNENNRICSICNNLNNDIVNMAANLLECSESKVLLNHDAFIILQRLFGVKRYDDYEMFDSNATENKKLLSEMQPLYQAINDFSDILEEEYGIEEDDKKHCAWELITRAAPKHFAPIWQENYEVYLDIKLAENISSEADGMLDRYIESVIMCNEINHEAEAVLAYFTFYIMYKKYIVGGNYFPAFFENVKAAFETIGEKLRKNSFKNRLKNSDTITKPTICYTLDDVDMMNGNEFEHFICELYLKMGYSAEVTKQSSDQGIDVIAQKSDKRIGIQAKCYSGTVGNSAVQEAVAGKRFYDCDKVIVVTNNYFTPSAIDLAQANDVILWDRNILKEKITELF